MQLPLLGGIDGNDNRGILSASKVLFEGVEDSFFPGVVDGFFAGMEAGRFLADL